MHIVHLTTWLRRAGDEESTVATCEWQVQAGHHVTLIHGADYDPFWDAALPQRVRRFEVPELVHSVRPARDAQALSRLRTLFKDLRPDVIHTHQSKAGILGRLAARVVPQAVVAHSIHRVPFEGVSPAKRALYIAAEKIVARRTNVFIGAYRAVGDAYVQAGIAAADAVHCVHPGMDLMRFRQSDLPADWRSVLDLEHGQPRPPVVLMMAAFERGKGHVTFLRGFAKVADDVPDVKILLAGQGPEEDRVRAAVRTLGLSKRVVFCGHRADPEALFAMSDLSVLTSTGHGLPRVVVQSLAAGCPIVAQARSALDDVLINGRNGYITEADNPDDTWARISALLGSPIQLRRLRLGAFATDLADRDVAALGARTTALYGLSRNHTVQANREMKVA